ncbi:uncharacterized protein LOC131072404 isoform X5 [Cryptomeria japonica]|uniref:uncharacterized protein LOC131072404 isoform X5 n=1 Tax=Cryptomeria japonica TaxID=3369 RepID=UPI0025AC1DD0|nr:uncharacterized protein LOC131072404 isoform X5 [Cryptomeria japonica]
MGTQYGFTEYCFTAVCSFVISILGFLVLHHQVQISSSPHSIRLLLPASFCRRHKAVPAGIYAKIHYGTSLSNVDWLHGSAESLLTLTNLFIVLGLREGLRKEESQKMTLGTEEKKEILEEERSSI